MVLISYATMAQTVQHTVRELRRAGRKVGMIRIRMLRPFPAEQLTQLMRSGVKYIVLDRNIGFGSGGIFGQEIRNALFRHKFVCDIFDVSLGLGGRDISPATIRGLLQNSWKCHSEEHEVRRRIFNSLHGTKSRFFAALRMTMLKVGFVLSQQSHQ